MFKRGLCLVVVLTVAACSSPSAPEVGGSGEAGECTMEVAGFEYRFETAAASCGAAEDAGRQLAVDAGLATTADSDAAATAMVSVCRVVQGGDPVTAEAATRALAAELVREVCPGDLARLTAP